MVQKNPNRYEWKRGKLLYRKRMP
ncbi:hypothetical protein NC651_026663 [Populus alba x Populus x berolinensis]|nr:hypothetical protein NC651_026663 [Populus alba x Populus x berolinensis]